MDFKSFIGGCLGGCAGILSSYPFDTIKVRIQNQNTSNNQYKSAIDCLTKTLKCESVAALYKGVCSPLIGSMFINAILFGVEENVRSRLNLKQLDREEPRCTKGNYKLFAISGAIAGLTQSFLLSPVELVKIKMQIPNCAYLNTWHCAKDLLTNKHYGYLTRGMFLTIFRDVPAVSSYFIGFEFICNSFTKPRENLTIVNLLLAGGFAGCLSWVITYPIDVIKTRYQADHRYVSEIDCLKKTLTSQGYKSLWRGLVPTLLRAFPNNAAIFSTVTLFNRLIDKSLSNDDMDSPSVLAIAKTKYLLEHNDFLR